ncbi:unnamed protein product, partial [Symbiodinium natans]
LPQVPEAANKFEVELHDESFSQSTTREPRGDGPRAPRKRQPDPSPQASVPSLPATESDVDFESVAMQLRGIQEEQAQATGLDDAAEQFLRQVNPHRTETSRWAVQRETAALAHEKREEQVLVAAVAAAQAEAEEVAARSFVARSAEVQAEVRMLRQEQGQAATAWIEAEAASSKREHLGSQLAVAKSQTQELQVRSRELLVELDAERAQQQATRSERDQLNSELSSAESHAQELQVRSRELLVELDAERAQHQAARGERDQLNSELTSAESHAQELQARSQELLVELDAERAQQQASRGERDQLNSELTSAESHAQELQVRSRELLVELDAERAQQQASRGERDQLNSELTSAESHAQELQARSRELLAELDAERAKQQQAARGEGDQLNSELSSAESHAQELQARSRELLVELDAERAQQQAARGERDHLHSELASAESQAQELQARCRDLLAERNAERAQQQAGSHELQLQLDAVLARRRAAWWKHLQVLELRIQRHSSAAVRRAVLAAWRSRSAGAESCRRRQLLDGHWVPWDERRLGRNFRSWAAAVFAIRRRRALLAVAVEVSAAMRTRGARLWAWRAWQQVLADAPVPTCTSASQTPGQAPGTSTSSVQTAPGVPMCSVAQVDPGSPVTNSSVQAAPLDTDVAVQTGDDLQPQLSFQETPVMYTIDLEADEVRRKRVAAPPQQADGGDEVTDWLRCVDAAATARIPPRGPSFDEEELQLASASSRLERPMTVDTGASAQGRGSSRSRGVRSAHATPRRATSRTAALLAQTMSSPRPAQPPPGPVRRNSAQDRTGTSRLNERLSRQVARVSVALEASRAAGRGRGSSLQGRLPPREFHEVAESEISLVQLTAGFRRDAARESPVQSRRSPRSSSSTSRSPHSPGRCPWHGSGAAARSGVAPLYYEGPDLRFTSEAAHSLEAAGLQVSTELLPSPTRLPGTSFLHYEDDFHWALATADHSRTPRGMQRRTVGFSG